ncbi:MAG: hypothetical protein WC604_04420 [Candidatus Gracilibacteria bacterium]
MDAVKEFFREGRKAGEWKRDCGGVQGKVNEEGGTPEESFGVVLGMLDVCFGEFSAYVEMGSVYEYAYPDFIGEVARLANTLGDVYSEVFLGVVLSKIKVLGVVLGDELKTSNDLIFSDIVKRMNFYKLAN